MEMNSSVSGLSFGLVFGKLAQPAGGVGWNLVPAHSKGLRPSSALPPVVARMRKLRRVGSLTLQLVSDTKLTWLPVAGGPVLRVVPPLSPKRSTNWLGIIPLSE